MNLNDFVEYKERYSQSIGLYVFYFKNLKCIDQFDNVTKNLILNNLSKWNLNIAYIGMTKSSFKKRDLKKHFNGKIAESTLRKTLCALLGISREIYTSGKMSKQKCTIPEDENKISKFIIENFECKILPIKNKNSIELIEKELICKYQPALNINGRVNDELVKRLKSLRKVD